MLRLRTMVLVAWIGVGLIELPLEAQVNGDSATVLAERFVRALEAGDWEAAAGMVGPRMRAAGVTATMLDQTWQQLTSTGELAELRADTVLDVSGYRVVDLVARFGAVRHRLRISVDAEGRVEGFRLFPATAPSDFPEPSYAEASAYEEVELTVGAEGWPLGATLTLPKGVKRAPVVVLVHGSGAHDRDETVAGNKPFRDLAHGLASRGVGVLRYEKRNWKHTARMVEAGSFTVDQEVIEDALAALARARSHPRVDAARVYLLGHSLGGMLAPEIAARDGATAGVILLAGSPRPLTLLIREQVSYLGTLPENASPQAQAQLTALRVLAERLEQRELRPEEQAMGAPASYFYDLAERDVLGFLTRVRAPVLVLQGGRDYQVTRADFDAFRQALAGREGAAFHFYEDLNHLFMQGTGTATPTEYAVGKGHVDERVIDDIAGFVRGTR